MKWQIALGIILLVLLIVSVGWNKKKSWAGSLDSPAALGQAVVDALNRGDVDGLHQLRVNRDEYLSWIWPTFPASRPPYNFTADFAWLNLDKKCVLGTNSWIERYGRQDLVFTAVQFERPTEAYKGFKLLRGTVLIVQQASSNKVELRILGSIVKKGNRYKLLSYED